MLHHVGGDRDLLREMDAMQAIMAALRTPPDAILLDVSMPGGTGLQVLRQLKNSVKTNMVPIIVIIVITGSLEPKMAATLRGGRG
ncbi:MAG: response regulator [Terriglobales bacterium]